MCQLRSVTRRYYLGDRRHAVANMHVDRQAAEFRRELVAPSRSFHIRKQGLRNLKESGNRMGPELTCVLTRRTMTGVAQEITTMQLAAKKLVTHFQAAM